MSVMLAPFVEVGLLRRFLERIAGGFGHAGTVYLLGETGHVYQGWIPRAELIEIATEVAPQHRADMDRVVATAADELGVEVIDESPAELIPLPAGHRQRHRELGPLLDAISSGEGEGEGALRLAHFDPYSIAFRYIARGDEPDYHVVLHLLEKGWITLDRLEAELEDLLPSFSMTTIQQDPAEFRRKYHGLQQMWHAVRAGTTHRPTEI